MRIRFKKSATLFGVIAGAAIATALIVFNVNQGNSVNVSDMENSGFLSGLGDDIEEALNNNSQSAVIANSDSADTAASAGALMTDFEDEPQNTQPVSQENGSAREEASEDEDLQQVGEQAEPAATADDAGYVETSAENGIQISEMSDDVHGEVQTYVEAVPQTRTETVVAENVVTIEKPVTVVEEINEEVEVDPVNFYAQTDAAVSGEISTTRRDQEALAAMKADKERLEADMQRNAEIDATEEGWRVPVGDDYSDGFIFN